MIDISLKFRLGHTRRLEILPIKVGGPSVTKCLQRCDGWACAIRHTQRHNCAEDVGPK